jgi:hypothetical protein
MSDSVLVALIGVGGTIVGAVATILVARMQAAGRSVERASPNEENELVLGEHVDIRQLRILRALFGERRGRYLEAYHDDYYRPALEATIRNGWVMRIDRRYHMTPKGLEFCRAYLQQLLIAWQPPV